MSLAPPFPGTPQLKGHNMHTGQEQTPMRILNRREGGRGGNNWAFCVCVSMCVCVWGRGVGSFFGRKVLTLVPVDPATDWQEVTRFNPPLNCKLFKQTQLTTTRATSLTLPRLVGLLKTCCASPFPSTRSPHAHFYMPWPSSAANYYVRPYLYLYGESCSFSLLHVRP